MSRFYRSLKETKQTLTLDMAFHDFAVLAAKLGSPTGLEREGDLRLFSWLHFATSLLTTSGSFSMQKEEMAEQRQLYYFVALNI